jgi:F-type H+-transporting ATPase subunit beta
VQQHLGGGQVRAVALGSTDGLVRRGMSRHRHRRQPVSVPSARRSSAACSTCWANPIDGMPAPEGEERSPIHREPPEFSELNPKTEVLETGIKVIDLLCPFVRGGKIGLFGGAGVGKTVIIQEMIARVAT